MPTSINVAKQHLTAESSHALEEAVNVARRRGHSQTTSLHAVSALLTLPTSSILRDACARVRNSAYSPRLQFKALDLCLSVSLDRIQSGQSGSDDNNSPPVSNSFMAAIKRSQAHQRRLPENFRIYQEISQNSNLISCVKVELRQLILSILDDPVVSRVFGEAGFRSSELKLSIIRPIPHLLRYSSQQPLFLCNLNRNLEPDLNPHHKSSLMGSFVPFGGFFSTPSDLKLPFSGFNKEITGPVSSVSDQTQSTLPPWLRMTTRRDLNHKSSAKINEGLESVCGNKSTSSVSASTGSAKSVITDLNLRIYPKYTSSSCLDNPRDLKEESIKIIYRRLTDSVLGQDEAARVISSALSQPPKNTTRRDVWLNLVGSDTVSKRRMSLVLAEIVYQSEHRFMAVDLGSREHDDVMQLRGKTMVDHIFEVMCRNPFCVVFLENIEKADEKLQISLLKAIETGKFMDSHGREVGIGNTMFVMTSDSGEREEKLLRAKDKQMEIWIETVSRSVSNPSSMNKRKLSLEKALEIGKRLNRTSNGVLDLNLPAQETEETYEENSNIWLTKLKNHDRLIEVPFKPFDFDGLAKRIKESVKESFDKTVRLDCLLEIDTKIMERILATVYFSDNRKDMIKELMEKELTRVFLKVKERYEITTSCVVKLVGRDLEIFREEQMDLFVVRSQ